MTRPTVGGTLREIADVTGYLVAKGLVDDQNFPYRKDFPDGVTEVRYPGALGAEALLRNRPYLETYGEQLAARAFNFRMLDGALIQMSYTFTGQTLTSGRLAFLPSPDLSEYQNDPEIYEEDSMFAEVVDRRVVTVPVRFDFDTNPKVVVDVDHPKSHLTLGQYRNCRIATTAALTPGAFVGFLLRSFYNTAAKEHTTALPLRAHRFDETITAAESQRVHISVP